jgi:hypothetical protein
MDRADKGFFRDAELIGNLRVFLGVDAPAHRVNLFESTLHMYRGHLSHLYCLAGLLMIAAAPCHAETRVAGPIEYKATVNEDPAAKVCQLVMALGSGSAGEAVNFQLMVAQMKRQGALAGPLVTGFTVDSPRRGFSRQRSARQARFTSVAFVSERYTSVALPKLVPFDDGSLGTSTLDFAEGRELITAVLRAGFELLFTRDNSSASASYKVESPPPADVLSEFSVCVSSLASY